MSLISRKVSDQGDSKQPKPSPFVEFDKTKPTIKNTSIDDSSFFEINK